MRRSIVYCSICGCPFQDISWESIEGEFDDDTLPPDLTEVSRAQSVVFEEWFTFLVARPISSNWQG